VPRELPPRPNGEEQPSRTEINEYLNRLEERLIADPSGMFRREVGSERSLGSSRIYYEKARAKAETFIGALDPDLTVSVDEVLVEPEREGAQEYPARVLRFAHRKRAGLEWTMEIDESDEYIEHQFQAVVSMIYARKSSEE
jgi:hypothetical protein